MRNGPQTREEQAESLMELTERIAALCEAEPGVENPVTGAEVLGRLATITWEDALDIQRRTERMCGGGK